MFAQQSLQPKLLWKTVVDVPCNLQRVVIILHGTSTTAFHKLLRRRYAGVPYALSNNTVFRRAQN